MDLVQLSKEKGFMSRDKLIGVTGDYKYLWMCELQKWLRDVHNIEIAVQWFDNCYIKAVAKKPFKANTYRVEGIESYEEALEAGLQEALNLIS